VPLCGTPLLPTALQSRCGFASVSGQAPKDTSIGSPEHLNIQTDGASMSSSPLQPAGPLSTGRGALITFEGIDGAGKSTHLQWFADALERAGRTVRVTREPGGTALGESLRTLMLHTPMAPPTEALLAFASRNELVCQLIGPALAAGTWVVCDRFTDSTFASQGGGRAVDWTFLETLERDVIGSIQPDLTLWFDLPAAIAAQRRAAARQADRFESEDLAFFERVRLGYQRRAALFPERFKIIDATQGIDEIKKRLEEILITFCSL
jgi:dTMP kinase